nr:MAG TPA: hypothetical protein [Caudoviricetes sp.]
MTAKCSIRKKHPFLQIAKFFTVLKLMVGGVWSCNDKL